MSYLAPVERWMFDLEHIAGTFHRGLVAREDMRLVLSEAARFAQETLAPLDRLGDREGAKFSDGKVTLPPAFVAAYQAWSEAGWNGADLPEDFGGMGLPIGIAAALMEFWTSACMSFGLGPVLTQGAADVLHLHASDTIRQTYLARMVSGEWTATMNLTEPNAGSDLGALRTRAVPVGDGTYAITGNKIFITCGEHDYTPNIIHLVLARMPGSPDGTRGISLFLVPKFLVNSDGSLGARNDLRCAGIEHKAGIHASPTCMMAFGDNDGATGWLIGAENRGLAAMFTMMNKARLYTALQGTAVAERATQRALTYARERKQGSIAGEKGQVAIIRHPDVQRNLRTMWALTAGSRALIAAAAGALERQHAATSAQERAVHEATAALLTPVAKSFCSDIGVEVASIGVQVHGGMGYVEETGAIQHWRDARIVPIYEGTNGIQGIDLALRKLPLLGGQVVQAMFDGWRQALVVCTAGAVAGAPALARLEASFDALEAATTALNALQGDEKLALATPYIRLYGTVAAAGYMAVGLASAIENPDLPAFAEARRDFIYFLDAILPKAMAHAQTLAAGPASTLDAPLA